MGLFSCVFLIFLIRYWICIDTMYFFICNQCLPPLTLWVWIPLGRGVLNITLCDKICQWFSHGTPVSSTNKIDRHNITEILLKVVLNTITLTPHIKEGLLLFLEMETNLFVLQLILKWVTHCQETKFSTA